MAVTSRVRHISNQNVSLQSSSDTSQHKDRAKLRCGHDQQDIYTIKKSTGVRFACGSYGYLGVLKAALVGLGELVQGGLDISQLLSQACILFPNLAGLLHPAIWSFH